MKNREKRLWENKNLLELERQMLEEKAVNTTGYIKGSRRCCGPMQQGGILLPQMWGRAKMMRALEVFAFSLREFFDNSRVR